MEFMRSNGIKCSKSVKKKVQSNPKQSRAVQISPKQSKTVQNSPKQSKADQSFSGDIFQIVHKSYSSMSLMDVSLFTITRNCKRICFLLRNSVSLLPPGIHSAMELLLLRVHSATDLILIGTNPARGVLLPRVHSDTKLLVQLSHSWCPFSASCLIHLVISHLYIITCPLHQPLLFRFHPLQESH